MNIHIGFANQWRGEFKACGRLSFVEVAGEFRRGAWYAWFLVLGVGPMIFITTRAYWAQRLAKTRARVEEMLDERAKGNR